MQINVGSWWKWLQTSLIWCFFPNDGSDENSKTGKDEQHTKVIIWQASLPLTLIACLQRWYTTVVNRNKTEAQNSKQNHKTQNRITKPKTESQNSKQNHKTQSRITKLKTETQNSKQNHKTQNWFVGYKYATTSCKSTWDTVPYFGINGLSMILCLWSPLHPLSKLLAIQDHTQNLEEQLWMGGGRSVLYLTEQWPGAIWSKKRFFEGVSQHFCKWLKHCCFSIFSLYHDIHITVRQLKYLITVKYNLWQTNNKSAAHEIRQAVRYELNGPGCFMGYRSMTRCLRFCFFFWKHWLN